MPMANDFTVERDWGSLLPCAFPGGNVTKAALTPAQRQLVFRALVTDGGQAPDD